MYNRLIYLVEKTMYQWKPKMVSWKINQLRHATHTFTESIQEVMDRGLNASGLFFDLKKHMMS
jgi:hypothetical protein